MLLNLLGIGALIFLAYLCFTLCLRSLRARHLAAKILGGLLAGLLTLVFVVALAAAFLGLWRTRVPYALAAPTVKVAATPELVSRGQTLAQSCSPCHSREGDAILNGGSRNFAVGLAPYGAVYAPNLTPGGEIKGWTDGQLIRALREGIDDQGLPLIGHPARDYAGMTDADAAALVAYLRSQQALRNDQPPRNLNLLGLWAAAGGLLQTSDLSDARPAFGSGTLGVVH